MNKNRIDQKIPPEVLTAIDHVRRFFPSVDLVVFNDMGRWQFMSEDFEAVKFENADIDVSLLERASEVAYIRAGHPSVFQAYTSEEIS